MNELTVLAAVAGLVMLFVVAEIIAAVLPVIIVVALVPPEERAALADLIAATDSSRRLRLWPALRTAVGRRPPPRSRAQRREGRRLVGNGATPTTRPRPPVSGRSPGAPRRSRPRYSGAGQRLVPGHRRPRRVRSRRPVHSRRPDAPTRTPGTAGPPGCPPAPGRAPAAGTTAGTPPPCRRPARRRPGTGSPVSRSAGENTLRPDHQPGEAGRVLLQHRLHPVHVRGDLVGRPGLAVRQMGVRPHRLGARRRVRGSAVVIWPSSRNGCWRHLVRWPGRRRTGSGRSGRRPGARCRRRPRPGSSTGSWPTPPSPP